MFFRDSFMPKGNIKIRAEDRSLRFNRVAEGRTNKIIKMISLLGNCSNKSSYNYSEEEINRIFSVIDRELKQAKSRFRFNRNKQFKL